VTQQFFGGNRLCERQSRRHGRLGSREATEELEMKCCQEQASDIQSNNCLPKTFFKLYKDFDKQLNSISKDI
jgi:hypothetical protein